MKRDTEVEKNMDMKGVILGSSTRHLQRTPDDIKTRMNTIHILIDVRGFLNRKEAETKGFYHETL